MNLICLFKSHVWKKLVIPENAFGDPRMEGKICIRCHLMRDLVEHPISLHIFDKEPSDE